jgi:3-deoxy-7-phosphoheptulonate synthase
MSFSSLRTQMRGLRPNVCEHGGFELVLGPCAIESVSDIEDCASAAVRVGATYLRGGAIKLRTNHRSFAGLGTEAWQILGRAAKAYGLKSVSEVTRAADVAEAALHIDALQIGARCMWHFDLLEAAAASNRKVILKRGMGASTREWLAAAERLQAYGCREIILCERGDRGADGTARNAVDISVLVFLADECPLPLWLDVSHSSGDPAVATSLLRRASALGLAGAMAEVHPEPERALCDGEQAIRTASLLVPPAPGSAR